MAPEREEATSHLDTYHRYDDPPNGEEHEAVTGRPNDLVEGQVQNSTLAARARARTREKRVDEAENKAVQSAATKKPRKPSK